jgi:hypothetical protein
LPCRDPSFTESNLLRRPLSKGRRIFHARILTFDRHPDTELQCGKTVVGRVAS